MMNKKNTKEKYLISFVNNTMLFMLLCVFSTSYFSAQIFVSNGAQIFIDKKATVTPNLSESKKTDSTTFILWREPQLRV